MPQLALCRIPTNGHDGNKWHQGCTGNIQHLYIRMNEGKHRTWLSIGFFCERCGEIDLHYQPRGTCRKDYHDRYDRKRVYARTTNKQGKRTCIHIAEICTNCGAWLGFDPDIQGFLAQRPAMLLDPIRNPGYWNHIMVFALNRTAEVRTNPYDLNKE